MPPQPSSFTLKKSRILSSLSVPESTYDDLSPKGSIDTQILPLIEEINSYEGFVTTSSCAGRVSVFLEGRRSGASASSEEEEAVQGERDLDVDVDMDERENGEETQEKQTETKPPTSRKAGIGGKGGGGKWLFVSHDPLEISKTEAKSKAWMETFGMIPLPEGYDPEKEEQQERRLIHFKFEPLILHILASSPTNANTLLTAALQAGFRESGALNLLPSLSQSSNSFTSEATPQIAIRTQGLTLESVIGFHWKGENVCCVPEWQLDMLVRTANGRFEENERRRERLGKGLRTLLTHTSTSKTGDSGPWETKEARRERKRREGMSKKAALHLGENMREDYGGEGDDEFPALGGFGVEV